MKKIKQTANEKLIQAARNGNIEGVKEALLAGADIHAEDDAALGCAAYCGHVEIVRLLIERGANVNAMDGAPLRGAAFEYDRHVMSVRILFGDAAFVNSQDGAALRDATSEEYIEIARLLLEHGATIPDDDVREILSKMGLEAFNL